MVILALCGYVMSQLLAKMRLADIGPAVAALPVRALAESLAFTAASFVTLVGYDWSAMRYVGQRLPIRTLAFASFCGYAIGNTVGFSLLTGGSVRFRIYSAAGVRTDDIGRVALFCVIAFGFGICAMSAFGVLLRPGLLSVILDIPRLWLQAGSIATIVSLAGFFFLCHKRRAIRLGRIDLPLPSTSLVAGQLTISAIDLCFACAALYVLLPADLHFSFTSFLPLYCVAIVAGLMSHVPGGLGVFEAVMVYALGDQTAMGGLVGALHRLSADLLRAAAGPGGRAARHQRDAPAVPGDPGGRPAGDRSDRRHGADHRQHPDRHRRGDPAGLRGDADGGQAGGDHRHSPCRCRWSRRHTSWAAWWPAR